MEQFTLTQEEMAILKKLLQNTHREAGFGSVVEAWHSLSPRLRHRLLHPHAFERAVMEGHIVSEHGGLRWTLGSQKMLTYFLARLFCGDHSRRCVCSGTLVWCVGDMPFPSSELGRLFGVRNLSNIRSHGKLHSLSADCLVVDALFGAVVGQGHAVAGNDGLTSQGDVR